MKLRKEDREAMGYTRHSQITTVHRITVRRPDIENGIPMPKIARPTEHDYPYEEMKIGDSFKIMETETPNSIVMSRVHSWMRGPKNTTRLRFACRKGKDADKEKYTRVWRMEDDPSNEETVKGE